jgi:ATPase subunit of ABC transporter with duplicated ATPase domains
MPTASTGWSSILARYEGTVIAVTHDRYFLDNVAGWILELDHGHGIPWKGNYSSWLEQKQAMAAVEQRTEDKRQKAMARELEWIRSSAKARVAKGQARINAYEAMLKQDVAEQEKQIRDHHSARTHGSAHLVVEAQKVGQGLRRQRASLRRIWSSRCRPVASSASSDPTARARPRCLSSSPALEKPDAGERSRSATR